MHAATTMAVAGDGQRRHPWRVGAALVAIAVGACGGYLFLNRDPALDPNIPRVTYPDPFTPPEYLAVAVPPWGQGGTAETLQLPLRAKLKEWFGFRGTIRHRLPKEEAGSVVVTFTKPHERGRMFLGNLTAEPLAKPDDDGSDPDTIVVRMPDVPGRYRVAVEWLRGSGGKELVATGALTIEP